MKINDKSWIEAKNIQAALYIRRDMKKWSIDPKTGRLIES